MSISMQEYYDKTIEHLRNQEKQAGYFDGEEGEFKCMYRDPNGNRCAVGIHIPESHIDELAANGAGIFAVSGRYPELAGTAWPEDQHGLSLARALQGLHDSWICRGDGKEEGPEYGGLSPHGEQRAMDITREYGLTYTPPAA